MNDITLITDKEKATIPIFCYVSEQEKADIELRAYEVGLSASAYLRHAVQVRNYDLNHHDANSDKLDELEQLKTDINALAHDQLKAINDNKQADDAVLNELIDKLDKLTDLLNTV